LALVWHQRGTSPLLPAEPRQNCLFNESVEEVLLYGDVPLRLAAVDLPMLPAVGDVVLQAVAVAALPAVGEVGEQVPGAGVDELFARGVGEDLRDAAEQGAAVWEIGRASCRGRVLLYVDER